MDRKYILDTDENRAFLKITGDNLLDFGRNFASPFGASYYLGWDGKPWKDRPLETWITARMAHVYAIASIRGFEQGASLAQKALNGLLTVLHDKEHGGWYSGIEPQGKPIGRKQCYAHAFVILAACSCLLAGLDGAKELLEQALDVYNRFFWDDAAGLARDTWDTSFAVCEPYRGINSNMHSVEAFLAVWDATGVESYKKRAGRVIEKVIQWTKTTGGRVPEHFSEDWTPDPLYNIDSKDHPFKPFGATPGHGIEWARLILQYSRDDRYLNASRLLFDRAVEDGWQSDGKPGFVYTTDWEGNPVVHDRNHWTLAEGINTAAILYRHTTYGRYAGLYSEFMQYLDEKVIDHRNGSWFHQLDMDGKVLDTVWPGKCDLYHAYQSTIIPYTDGTRSIARAVLKGW